MVTVEVHLFANLRKYAPPGSSQGAFTLRLQEGTTLGDLLRELGIPEKEFKQAFVNRLRRGEDYTLQEGDRVALFSPIAGG